MTRGQRRAHRILWALLGLLLAGASAWALLVERPIWVEAEAITSEGP